MLQRIVLLLLLAFAFAETANAQTPCPSKLFVSGYNSTVHIYDACTGAFLRELDARGRITGAQAVKVGPDGNIYVVSEQTSRILKYHRETFAFLGDFATVTQGPTGFAFDAQGRMYVSRYDAHNVQRFSATGTLIDTPIASPLLRGPDNGTIMGPDNRLYIPGYDSHNFMRFDPATNELVQVVAPRAQGMASARGMKVAKDGVHIFMSAEISGQIFKYNVNTQVLTLLADNINRPSGMDYLPDGNLAVATRTNVLKINPDTGANMGVFITAGLGGLSFPTFAAVIASPGTATTVDVVEYFNIALAKYFITGRAGEKATLDGFPAAFRRTGARFAAFAASDAPAGTESICRFYLPPAKGGPNSHFYGRPADCDLIRGTNNPLFEYEGEDFAVIIPVSGACPASAPFTVYRSFNNRAAQNDGNHRYTNTLARYNEMSGKGWAAEGPVFCSSGASDGTE